MNYVEYLEIRLDALQKDIKKDKADYASTMLHRYRCRLDEIDSIRRFLLEQNKIYDIDGIDDQINYLCPEGIIKEDELPCGWGLIYVNDRGKTREVKESEFWNLTASGHANEKYFLYSIARILQNSKTVAKEE